MDESLHAFIDAASNEAGARFGRSRLIRATNQQPRDDFQAESIWGIAIRASWCAITKLLTFDEKYN
jgi:hypothetical protein